MFKRRKKAALFIVLSAVLLICSFCLGQAKPAPKPAPKPTTVPFASTKAVITDQAGNTSKYSDIRIIYHSYSSNPVNPDAATTHEWRYLELDTGVDTLFIPFGIIRQIDFDSPAAKGADLGIMLDPNKYKYKYVFIRSYQDEPIMTATLGDGTTLTGTMPYVYSFSGIPEGKQKPEYIEYFSRNGSTSKPTIQHIVFSSPVAAKAVVPAVSGGHVAALILKDGSELKIRNAAFVKEKVDQNLCLLGYERSDSVTWVVKGESRNLTWSGIDSITPKVLEPGMGHIINSNYSAFGLATKDGQQLEPYSTDYPCAYQIEGVTAWGEYNLQIRVSFFGSYQKLVFGK